MVPNSKNQSDSNAAEMPEERLISELRSGGVLLVTINRPAKRNALDQQTLDRLGQVFSDYASDDRVKLAVLTAAGTKTLGTGTFQLLLSAAQVPDPHKDHKVDARGFLIRRPAGNRINITGLETVAPDCGK